MNHSQHPSIHQSAGVIHQVEYDAKLFCWSCQPKSTWISWQPRFGFSLFHYFIHALWPLFFVFLFFHYYQRNGSISSYLLCPDLKGEQGEWAIVCVCVSWFDWHVQMPGSEESTDKFCSRRSRRLAQSDTCLTAGQSIGQTLCLVVFSIWDPFIFGSFISFKTNQKASLIRFLKPLGPDWKS